jgi:uncharacterized membrane protein
MREENDSRRRGLSSARSWLGKGTMLRFDNMDHFWLWALALAAGIWWLYTTYRGIFERSQRRLTWFLFALRCAGIAALVLALLKPVWVRRQDIVEPGRVPIVLDNSLSMSLPDATGQPRYQRARDAADRLRADIAAQRAGPRLAADLFDINGLPLAQSLPEQPTIERTDLARALSQAAARLRSKPVTAIVLISDGIDNSGRADMSAMQNSAVPIFTVGFREDTDKARMDLAVRRVQAPTRIIVNNNVKVSVVVEKSGGPAAAATLAVKRGAEILAEQTIELDAGRTERIANVVFTPKQAGRFVFTAAVAAPAGEKTLANNAALFPLQVDAEPIRVFYLEGFLRHEYKFLKNRLEDDPDISLVSIVRRANPERGTPGSGGELITDDRLAKFDVVILGDMEADYLTGAEYQALLKWVDQGHALLVLGGYRSFGPTGFRVTPLADALPVVFADSEPYQNETPFTLTLTDEGLRHPIFEITGDRVKDAGLWNAAPALLGASLIKQTKPGADVLAVNPTLTAEDKPMTVVAVQRYGAGHAMVLAVDTTWRWSRLTRVMGQADILFARFWSQTLRWLSGRARMDERPLLTVHTDKPDYEVGKPVAIRAVYQPRPDSLGKTAGIAVEVAGDNGQSVAVPVLASSLEPEVFAGAFYPSIAGRYQLLATLQLDGKPAANQATEFMVHGSGLELGDTRINKEQLQAIAGASGGLYVEIDDAASLAAKLPRKERRTLQVNRTEYWNSPALFLFFIAAVSAEWILRRRHHLV